MKLSHAKKRKSLKKADSQEGRHGREGRSSGAAREKEVDVPTSLSLLRYY